MTLIPEAPCPHDYPDRFLDCQSAIEGPLQALIAIAISAKWGEAETCAAIVELADNLMLARAANIETDLQITTKNLPLDSPGR